jgi:hypothetical protein
MRHARLTEQGPVLALNRLLIAHGQRCHHAQGGLSMLCAATWPPALQAQCLALNAIAQALSPALQRILVCHGQEFGRGLLRT